MKYQIWIIDDSPNSVLAGDSKTPLMIRRRTAVDFEVVLDEWISVKDRLPKALGPKVLLWADFDNSSEDCKIGFLITQSAATLMGPEPLWNIDGEAKTWPTHWQPLPEPPKEV